MKLWKKRPHKHRALVKRHNEMETFCRDSTPPSTYTCTKWKHNTSLSAIKRQWHSEELSQIVLRKYKLRKTGGSARKDRRQATAEVHLLYQRTGNKKTTDIVKMFLCQWGRIKLVNVGDASSQVVLFAFLRDKTFLVVPNINSLCLQTAWQLPWRREGAPGTARLAGRNFAVPCRTVPEQDTQPCDCSPGSP